MGLAPFYGQPREKTRLAQMVVNDSTVRRVAEIYCFHAGPIRDPKVADTLLFMHLDNRVLLVEALRSKKHNKHSMSHSLRHRVVVAVGTRDGDGNVGVATYIGSDVGKAIKGAVGAAKCAIIPVQKGYYDSRTGRPHTLPFKVTGKCGGTRVTLRPAPRGTGVHTATGVADILHLAGVLDVCVDVNGESSGNSRHNTFMATFDALCNIHKTLLRPELWDENRALVQSAGYTHWNPVAAPPANAGKSYWCDTPLPTPEDSKEKEEEREKGKEKENKEEDKDKEREGGQEKGKEEHQKEMKPEGEPDTVIGGLT